MVDIERRNGLPFDAILGAEYARAYVMQPVAYERSCAALDLPRGPTAPAINVASRKPKR